MKNLYRIDLNWYGETHTFYKYATSEEHALKLAIIAFEKEVDKIRSSIRNYIISGDRYLVTKEKQF